MGNLKRKTILLGISGGIAAYKMCDLARQLVRASYNVKVIMTQHAAKFVGPATFRSLTGNPVALDLFDDPAAPINHISLAEEADLFLIAPATANVIAKLAHGRADDLLTTTALAYQGQLLVAPAMNTQMYLDSVTQENLATLTARGAQLIGPASGELACGDSGPGRMVEAQTLFGIIEDSIQTSDWLAGKKVLISAGSTQEYLDPVRYLTNRSSGKMGTALTRAALQAGAEVQLVLGPASAAVPVDKRLACTRVVTADEMCAAMISFALEANLIICSAAVSDYRPAKKASIKIKKRQSQLGQTNQQDTQVLELVQNPDILAKLGRMKIEKTLKADTILVGFAAETNNLEDNAQAKLERKGADYIIANDVSRADIGFESTENEVRIFSKAAPEADTLLPKTSKTQLARQILQRVYPLS
ncbi:MAG: bifunctional phosphopantothenoylcysteine decarboxylase/phosphopantothenate--cysteine ligase CoaBC [Coriobacteriia bacterium]|nr:bifunctional phosphopantothenoylcysteine decarboxylase/phosphopantothenate--cysteine ligase CoaBC [Coriobacteriia bacterium]MCL2870572.1 bifunctional phosphopantothenoylcysteine decarboxylase/phosphopantothenate--cysteine ligase CoaBC [Coriobacteriia bacterium]